MSNGWHVDNNVCVELFAQLRARAAILLGTRAAWGNAKLKNNVQTESQIVKRHLRDQYYRFRDMTCASICILYNKELFKNLLIIDLNMDTWEHKAN